MTRHLRRLNRVGWSVIMLQFQALITCKYFYFIIEVTELRFPLLQLLYDRY